MNTIMPCLWFDDSIEEAITFYTGTFPSARLIETARPDAGRPPLTAIIELEGQKFMLLNGGKVDFAFNESVSFMIECDGQAEVDAFWEKLTSEGGSEGQCGWCKDRFGLSWQVAPRQFRDTVLGPDPAGARRAMDAMMKMKKLDVAALQKAYAGT